MLLHLSVSHSVHRGAGGLPDRDPLDRDPPDRDPQTETPRTATSGRYTFYWNAFLFNSV